MSLNSGLMRSTSIQFWVSKDDQLDLAWLIRFESAQNYKLNCNLVGHLKMF